MLDKNMQSLIDKFLSAGYVEEWRPCYELIEKGNREGQGKSLLRLSVGDSENICVTNYDKKGKCEFLTEKWGMKKCIDHFVLRYCANSWELHMIEMKTTVKRDNWEEIKQKFRASYWNIKILAQFLGISFGREKVYLYTTYEREDMSIKGSANPRGHNLLLGEYIPDAEKEWNGENPTSILMLPYDHSSGSAAKFQHTKIKMSRSGSGERLEGSYSILQE